VLLTQVIIDLHLQIFDFVIDIFKYSLPSYENENSYSRLLKIKQPLIEEKLKERVGMTEFIGEREKPDLNQKLKEFKNMAVEIQRTMNR
jgi:hypothetical protein